MDFMYNEICINVVSYAYESALYFQFYMICSVIIRNIADDIIQCTTNGSSFIFFFSFWSSILYSLFA